MQSTERALSDFLCVEADWRARDGGGGITNLTALRNRKFAKTLSMGRGAFRTSAIYEIRYAELLPPNGHYWGVESPSAPLIRGIAAVRSRPRGLKKLWQNSRFFS